jgi:HEAT repeat protein
MQFLHDLLAVNCRILTTAIAKIFIFRMIDVLNQAVAAADREDWTAALNSLSLLTLSDRNSATTGDRERQIGLDLALKVLISGDFQQQWEVSKLIPRWGRQALDPLLDLLAGDRIDADARWFISRILSQFNHPASICALVQLLQEGDDCDLAAMASESLAQMGDGAIPALRDLLDDPRCRLLAVRALAQIPHPDTIDSLRSVLDDPSPTIRAMAVEALGSFQRDNIMSICIQSLRDPAPAVRQAAATVLGIRGDCEGRWQLVQHLSPLLADPLLAVAEQAAIALGRLGTPEAANVLFPVLKSPATPLGFKLTLVRSLGWIAHPQALHYLQLALHWCDRPACLAIIQALASQQLPELKSLATQALLGFLASGQQIGRDAQIRRQIAMALGELGDPLALPFLESLARDPDLQMRLHARAALRKALTLQTS